MLNYQRVSVFVCERSLVRWLLDGLYGARGSTIKNYETLTKHGDGSKPWYLVNPKIAGKWMFIPLKMVLIGIDPYPHEAWHGGSMRTWSINHALSSQAVPPKVIHILGSELQATGVNWPISAMNQKHGYPGIFHRLMQISIPKSWVGHGWTWFFGDQILGCPSRGPGSGTVRWTSWDVVSPVSGFSGLGPSNSSHQRGKSVPKSHGFSCIYIYMWI